ncbi:MAG: hypothetical protein KC502_17940 [Myxococcales bacterium]|nr:hypothetical protein [Myxococcales bacterium]
MVVIDLREPAAQGATAHQDLPDLTTVEWTQAIDTWRGRVVNETVSSRVFAAMIPQALAAGASADTLQRLARAVGDELRHGRQCAAVVSALGGDAYAEIEALQPVPTHDDASSIEGLLRNIISISCLSETVAVALIGAERLRTGPASIETTLSQILADEVQHARLGWAVLDN